MSSQKKEVYHSSHQDDIFEHISNEKGHLVVIARAGTGKTRVIVESTKCIPQGKKVLCIAFNRKIVSELKQKLPTSINTATINALGNRLYKDENAIFDRSKSLKVQSNFSEEINEKGLFRNIVTLFVSEARSRGYFPVKYNVDFSIPFEKLTTYIEANINDLAKYQEVVDKILISIIETFELYDFDDQIHSVLALGLVPSVKYDFIIVDEAQDFSLIKMKLLFRFLSEEGHMIAVGDPRQLIYSFAGAHSNAIQFIKDSYNSEEKILPICYRCSKAVVKEAQTIVHDIVHFENNKAGNVSEIHYTDIKWQNLGKDSMVICRNNKPLFDLALELMTLKIPFQFNKIDEIKKNIKTKITNSKARSIDELMSYFDNKIRKLEVKSCKDIKATFIYNEKIRELLDIQELLSNICAMKRVRTVKDIRNEIDSVISSEQGLLLTTAHQSKGLERKSVFILDKTLYKTDSYPEEENLLYVSITRAIEDLFYVVI